MIEHLFLIEHFVRTWTFVIEKNVRVLFFFTNVRSKANDRTLINKMNIIIYIIIIKKYDRTFVFERTFFFDRTKAYKSIHPRQLKTTVLHIKTVFFQNVVDKIYI